MAQMRASDSTKQPDMQAGRQIAALVVEYRCHQQAPMVKPRLIWFVAGAGQVAKRYLNVNGNASAGDSMICGVPTAMRKQASGVSFEAVGTERNSSQKRRLDT